MRHVFCLQQMSEDHRSCRISICSRVYNSPYLLANSILEKILNPTFLIGIPNRCCILELKANQYFLCNFFSMPRCQGLIAPKKVGLHEIS